MKMKCEIIRDLIPSYIDGLTSKESNEIIEEHLEECKDCSEMVKEMRSDISSFQDKDAVIQNKQEIKPFKKIKKKMRKSVAVTAVLCLVCAAVGFVGFNVYYNQTWEVGYEDVKLSVEAQGKVVTVSAAAKDENHSIVFQGNDGNSDTVTVMEKRNNPFAKILRKADYMGFTVIDENTVMKADGTSRGIGEEDVLTVRFKDTEKTFSMKELAEKALENPVASKEDVKMSWQKSDDGRVTFEFVPELMGTSLKVEQKDENHILIRMYYDGKGEPEENGAYYSLMFKDDNTLLHPDGSETKISGDEALTIEFQDETEEVLFRDLIEE